MESAPELELPLVVAPAVESEDPVVEVAPVVVPSAFRWRNSRHLDHAETVALRRHGLQRVMDQVQENLLHLIRVDGHPGQGRFQFDDQHDEH